MNIFFRVDSGDFIGGGHISRCINFANYYNAHHIHFICKNHSNNLTGNIPANFQKHILPITKKITENEATWLGSTWKEDADQCKNILVNCDVLIVDHYAIPIEWEKEMRNYTGKLMVIDDYSNRQHDCDIYFNQQIGENNGLQIPNNCRTILGEIIFNRQFEYIKPKEITECKRINIFMGAADHLNLTSQLFPLIPKFPEITFDIIVGGCNRHYEEIKEKYKDSQNVNLHYNLEFIGNILNEADLCIGGLSGTTYERFLLRKPSIHIVFSENQKTMISKIEKITNILNLDELHKIPELIAHYIANPRILQEESEKCNIINRNVFTTIKSIL